MVAYSFQRRFVTPIRIGLGLKIRDEDADPHGATMLTPKLHTIRAVGLRRHAMAGETLQLYCQQRSPACFLIGTAPCSDIKSILIKVGEDADMQFRINGKNLNDRKARDFARSDGFGSIEDMWLFWRKEHKGVDRFAGNIIEWEGKR